MREFSRVRLEELDTLAKRYKVLPSQIAESDPETFQFNLLVAQAGLEREAKAWEKQKKAGRHGNK